MKRYRSMDLLSLVIVLAVIGFAVWLVVTYVPMPQPVKTVIIAIVVLVLVAYILRAVGVPNVRL